MRWSMNPPGRLFLALEPLHAPDVPSLPAPPTLATRQGRSCTRAGLIGQELDSTRMLALGGGRYTLDERKLERSRAKRRCHCWLPDPSQIILYGRCPSFTSQGPDHFFHPRLARALCSGPWPSPLRCGSAATGAVCLSSRCLIKPIACTLRSNPIC
jgi:hypothetical protein